MLRKVIIGCGLFLAGSTLAQATLVQGTSLQNELDSRTRDGSFLDVNDDQAPADELWTLASINNGTAMIMFELAGFASTNTMGIYDPTDLSSTLELFSGSASTGAKISLLESSLTPGLFGTCVWTGFGCSATGDTITLAGGKFGLYLDSAQDNGTRFYSQSALNSDAAADGTTDHLVAFAGDGSEMLDPLNNGDFGIFAPGEYVIAWEDLKLSGSDRDYNDMVVLMESIIPVPEPTPLALLGMGLFGLGAARRFARVREG